MRNTKVKEENAQFVKLIFPWNKNQQMKQELPDSTNNL